jgi:hypothetical protein
MVYDIYLAPPGGKRPMMPRPTVPINAGKKIDIKLDFHSGARQIAAVAVEQS